MPEATFEFSEINCTDCQDCDWERYPNTGHKCEHHACMNEATVAVCLSPGNSVRMVCESHKPRTGT